MIDLNDFFEKSNLFSNIRYTDSDHSYLIGDIRAISGTQLIHKYVPEFKQIEIAKKTAEKRGVPVEIVLNDWAKNNVKSTVKGTLMHEFIELQYQKRVLEFDDKKIKEMVKSSLKRTDTYNPEFSDLKHDIDEVFINIKDSINKTMSKIKKFLEESNGSLIPILSEFIIGDPEYRICGTIDQLFYNKTYKTLQIWDWKTNNKIELSKKYENDKFMLEPIANIENTNYWHYSIQLSLYKFILQKITGLEVDKLWLCHFDDNNEDYVLHECPYLESEVKLILESNLKDMIEEENKEKEQKNNE